MSVYCLLEGIREVKAEYVVCYRPIFMFRNHSRHVRGHVYLARSYPIGTGYHDRLEERWEVVAEIQ